MAWIRHASRAGMFFEFFLKGHISGRRVSNTWVIYPEVRDNPGKLGLIPDSLSERMLPRVKGIFPASGRARGPSGSWWGNSPPSR